MLFFIAAECLATALVFGTGFLNGAIEELSDIAPWILSGVGVGALMTAIHFLISFFRKKREKVLYGIAEAAMLLGICPGILLFAELLNLDLCHRWFPWFGGNTTAQLFTVLGVLIAVCVLLMLLAYFLPLLPLRAAVLLLSVFVPAALYGHGMAVCTQSYSDYMSTLFSSAEPFQEYVVKHDTGIYYPSFDSEGEYPFLAPKGKSSGSFSEGDVVYLLSSMVAAHFRQQDYILVSDGEKAGLVEVFELKELDTLLYCYRLEVSRDAAPIFQGDTAGRQEEVSRVVLDTLPKGEELEYVSSLGGYLKIRLEDGTEGYIERSNVRVARTSALLQDSFPQASDLLGAQN